MEVVLLLYINIVNGGTFKFSVGDNVGIIIKPDLIHIMKKEFVSNIYDGVITKRNTVEFAEGEFECDVTQLYPEST